MKKLIIAALATTLSAGVAVAASPDKEHKAQKKIEEATPEMKNPGGTENLRPAQKAMDEATPDEKGGASSGESTGASGKAGGVQPQTAAFPDWDQRKAGSGVDLKAKSQ